MRIWCFCLIILSLLEEEAKRRRERRLEWEVMKTGLERRISGEGNWFEVVKVSERLRVSGKPEMGKKYRR